jgi:hypothetical protein
MTRYQARPRRKPWRQKVVDAVVYVWTSVVVVVAILLICVTAE